jgi:predicted esterase
MLLHDIDRGDPAAPCVVLFHGNGSMIQRLHHQRAC